MVSRVGVLPPLPELTGPVPPDAQKVGAMGTVLSLKNFDFQSNTQKTFLKCCKPERKQNSSIIPSPGERSPVNPIHSFVGSTRRIIVSNLSSPLRNTELLPRLHDDSPSLRHTRLHWKFKLSQSIAIGFVKSLLFTSIFACTSDDSEKNYYVKYESFI